MQEGLRSIRVFQTYHVELSANAIVHIVLKNLDTFIIHLNVHL